MLVGWRVRVVYIAHDGSIGRGIFFKGNDIIRKFDVICVKLIQVRILLRTVDHPGEYLNIL